MTLKSLTFNCAEWNIVVNYCAYIDRENLKLGLFSTFLSTAVYLVLVKHVLSGSLCVLVH